MLRIVISNVYIVEVNKYLNIKVITNLNEGGNAMKKKRNKRIFLVTAMILCFITGHQAFAADSGFYVPTGHQADAVIMWDNTTSVDVNLTVSAGKAVCGACVIGRPDVTQITGTVELARKNSDNSYTAVKTWSDLKAQGNKLIVDKTYYVTKGYTYRLLITANVYRNGSSETVSGSYEAYAPK